MATLAAVDRDQLIRDGMKYVHGIAWKMSRHNAHVPLEDLVSYGYRGLVKAARRFDPSLGQFGTFALPHIRGAMLDGIRRDSDLGRRDARKYAQIDRARHRYAAREQRFPTSTQLADELGWTPAELSAIQQSAIRATPGSLDFDLAIPDPTGALDTLADTVPDPNVDIERAVLNRCDHDRLIGLITQLPTRQRMVIALRFWEGMTLREIGDVLGVTESRVSQIASRALERLRTMAPDDLREAA